MSRTLMPLLLIFVLLLAACASPAGTPQTAAAPAPQGKLNVVVSHSILGDLVQNVGQDKIEVHTLVGPGEDAHTFEPSPGDSATLARAQLVFENGLEFEPWLDRLYTASGSRGERVAVTEGLQDLIKTDDHDEQDEDHADEKQDEHGEFDPHVWHDVNNTRHMVMVIRDALARTDPANAEVYRTDAERYAAELQTLDGWVAEQVETVPAPRRKLVTTHDTFSYFAHRYGFEVIGTALGSVSTESAEPAAGDFARLVQEIKNAGVPAIFAENVSNPRLMERLAAEAGVELAPTLYTDALDKPGSPGDTYIKMMRYNVTTIVTALKK